MKKIKTIEDVKNRAKWLYAKQVHVSMKACVKQAITELLPSDWLSDIYRIFDINLDEFAEDIVKTM